MDKEEIRSLIEEKEEIFDEIKKHKDTLSQLKSIEKEETAKLWLQTDWSEVIEGRPTDKTKKAFVDNEIRTYKEDVEFEENTITSLYHEVEIINDTLKFLGGLDD